MTLKELQNNTRLIQFNVDLNINPQWLINKALENNITMIFLGLDLNTLDSRFMMTEEDYKSFTYEMDFYSIDFELITKHTIKNYK